MIGKVLVLGATIVLARVLTPAEFGLVTLSLVIIGFVDVIADLGVSQALIYLDATRRNTDAAFLLTCLLGVLMAATMALGGPALAEGLGNQDAGPLLQLLSISLVMSALGIVPDTLLRRELNFRRRLPVTLSLAATRGLLAIGLALLGAGIWSLAIAQVVGQTVSTVVAWALVTYRPGRATFAVDRTDVRRLLSFGVPTAANGLLSTLALNVDYLVVGRVLGAAQLGFYTLAFRLPEMLIVGPFQITSSVIFPAFSRASRDWDRIRRGYIKVVRLQSAYGVVVGAILWVLAPLLIEVVFGARWKASAAPLQALAVYAALRSLGMGVVDLLKGIGRPRLALCIGALRFALVGSALVVVVQHGIMAVAVTQAAVALVLMLVVQTVACRVLRVPYRRLLLAFLPAAFGGLFAAGAALGVLAASPGESAITLGLAAAAGVVAGGTACLAWPQWRRDLASVLPARRLRAT